jgi:hypothetical protein
MNLALRCLIFGPQIYVKTWISTARRECLGTLSWHRIYKRLKLGGGQAYDRSSV